jgi:hypothetical protein
MQSTHSHALLTLAVVVLLGLLTDPFMVLMSQMQLYLVLVLVTTLLIVWVGLILREESTDEREVANRAFAARWGYVSGITILTTGLLYEGSVLHEINWWILFALIAKILSKFLARIYIESKN